MTAYRTSQSRGNAGQGFQDTAERKSAKALSCGSLTAYADTAQSVTSSTTLVNATELVASQLAPNTRYQFSVFLDLTLIAAGNIKADFSASTATMTTFTASAKLYGATSIAVTDLTALNTLIDGGTATIWLHAEITGSFLTATNGTLQMTFAQKASSATSSTINAGSFLRVMPLEHLAQ